MTPEYVILVDTGDREIGTAEKLEAHLSGALHRAFSIVIWDSAGRMLLQQRAVAKYHSGGLWTNTCCGHPRPGEDTHVAAARRLHGKSRWSALRLGCEGEHILRFRHDQAGFQIGTLKLKPLTPPA